MKAWVAVALIITSVIAVALLTSSRHAGRRSTSSQDPNSGEVKQEIIPTPIRNLPVTTTPRMIVICHLLPWWNAGIGNHLITYRGLSLVSLLFPNVPIYATAKGPNSLYALNGFLESPAVGPNVHLVDNITEIIQADRKQTGNAEVVWIGNDWPELRSRCMAELGDLKQSLVPGSLFQGPDDIVSGIHDPIVQLQKPVVGITDLFYPFWDTERKYMIELNRPIGPVVEWDGRPKYTPSSRALLREVHRLHRVKPRWWKLARDWISTFIGLTDAQGSPHLPYFVHFRRNMFHEGFCDNGDPKQRWGRKTACTQSLEVCLQVLQGADKVALASGAPDTKPGTNIKQPLGVVSVMVGGPPLQSWTKEEVAEMELKTHAIAWRDPEPKLKPPEDLYLLFCLGGLADTAYLNLYSTFSSEIFALREHLGKPKNSTVWY